MSIAIIRANQLCGCGSRIPTSKMSNSGRASASSDISGAQAACANYEHDQFMMLFILDLNLNHAMKL
jgi:hypothetical protein